jgi:predicted acylesterase/phospholipase RssA
MVSPIGNPQWQGVSNNPSTAWQKEVDNASAAPGLWSKLKSVFSSTPTTSVENLTKSKEAFKAFLAEEIISLGEGVPKESRAAFFEKAEKQYASILKETFSKVRENANERRDGSVDKSLLQTAVVKANEQAITALTQLTRERIADHAQANICPQVIARKDGSIQVIRAAPQIENLVLRGGGAKGIGYPSALIEMNSAGMLSGLKHMVGTSAGAITATGIASGMSAKEFGDFADSMKMDELLKTPDGFAQRYPGVDLGSVTIAGVDLGSVTIESQGGKALELLDQTTAKQVSNYLNENWDTEAIQGRLAQLDGAEVDRLQQLRQQDFSTDRTSQMVTFRDLHLMHQLDPAKFKELTLTGWNKEDQKEHYFNLANTPDLPVALAGRISMALPMLFTPVKLDLGEGMRAFTDGGIGSNMSSEVITDGKSGRALDEAKARTAVMTFDESGKAYSVMHDDSSARLGEPKWYDKALSGNDNRVGTYRADKDKIYNAGPNAFVVFHGDIETRDLGASDERVSRAKALSTLRTLEQIEVRQNQAYAVDYDTADDCFASLNDAEKQALRDAGPPKAGHSAGEMNDPAYRFQAALFDLAMRGDVIRDAQFERANGGDLTL